MVIFAGGQTAGGPAGAPPMAGGIPMGIPINIPMQPGAMPMGGMGGAVPPDVMQSIMSALGGMGAVPGGMPPGKLHRNTQIISLFISVISSIATTGLCN